MMLSYFILGLETLAVRGPVQLHVGNGGEAKKETFFPHQLMKVCVCVFVHDLWN